MLVSWRRGVDALRWGSVPCRSSAIPPEFASHASEGGRSGRAVLRQMHRTEHAHQNAETGFGLPWRHFKQHDTPLFFCTSVPDSKVHETWQYLASLRVMSVMLVHQCPGGRTFQRFLPAFCEASAPAGPCEGAFDDPSTGQNIKPVRGVGSFDDLDGPPSVGMEGGAQFFPCTATVGEHMAQPRETMPESAKDAGRTVAVLHAGRTDDGEQQKAEQVGDDVAPCRAGPHF